MTDKSSKQDSMADKNTHNRIIHEYHSPHGIYSCVSLLKPLNIATSLLLR